MSKITLLLAIVCLFVAVEAQRPSRTCANIYAKCLRAEPRNGKTNDLTDIFNRWCRWGPGTNSRGITRCELDRATCILTIDRCRPLYCEDVKTTLQ